MNVSSIKILDYRSWRPDAIKSITDLMNQKQKQLNQGYIM